MVNWVVGRRGYSLLSRGAFNVSIGTTYLLRCSSISRLHRLVLRKLVIGPCLRVNNKDGLLFAGSCPNAVLRSLVSKLRVLSRGRRRMQMQMNTNMR